MAQSYLVVEFLGDESVREISETWLFKSSDGYLKTWWPTYSTDRENNKAIMNHTALTNEWEVHNVRQLGGKYEDYLVVRNKAKAAEKHSDINSSTAEGNEHRRTRRRRIRANLSVYKGSHDHSCDEEATGKSILPSLPKPPTVPSTTSLTDSYMSVRRSPRKHNSKMNKRAYSTMDENCLDLGDYPPSHSRPAATQVAISTSNYLTMQPSSPTTYTDDDASNCLNNNMQPSSPNTYTGDYPPFHSRPSATQVVISNTDLNIQPSTSNTYTDISNASPYSNRRIFPYEQTPTTARASYMSPSHLTPPLPITKPVTSSGSECITCKDHARNYSQILRQLAEIKATQQHQQETLDTLLNQQEAQRAPTSLDRPYIQNMEDDCTANLPLKSTEDMASLEKKLTEEPNFKCNLTRQLSLIGGATTYDAVKRMMKKLMSDAVGEQYSFLGFKKKMRFDKLAVKDVLFNAVRLNSLTKNSTEKDMELAVKKWLQHAKTRANNPNAL